MGILLPYLPLFDAAHRRGGIASPFWVLGSQQIVAEGSLADWARERGYASMAQEPTTANLFRDRYGLDEYRDFDLNDSAAVKLDLSAPLPDEWRGGAGTVLDSGTIEHVYDIRRVMENTHEMLRPGGTLIALAPVNWWEHGFVNLNPKFYRAFAAANGYEPLVEGFNFTFGVPFLGRKYLNVITRDGAVRTRAKLWVDRMMNRVQPALTLYFCCYRRTGAEPFREPADVFDNW